MRSILMNARDKFRLPLTILLAAIILTLVSSGVRSVVFGKSAQQTTYTQWHSICEGYPSIFPVMDGPYPVDPYYDVYCYGVTDEVATPTAIIPPTDTQVVPSETPTLEPATPTDTPEPTTPTVTPEPPTPTNTQEPPPFGLDRVIDYEDTAYWPLVDTSYPERLIFQHASVGGTIAWGVYCQMDQRIFGETCKPYDLETGGIPYSMGQFTDVYFTTGSTKLEQFEALVHSSSSSYDVFAFKYCYLDCSKTFGPTQELYERLADQYPTKTFVMTTMALLPNLEVNAASLVGINSYNSAARAYMESDYVPENVWMVDVASMESHLPSGEYCANEAGEYLCDAWRGSLTGTGGHISKPGGEWISRLFWVLLWTTEQ